MLLTHLQSDSIDIVELSGRLIMADVPDVRKQLIGIVDTGQGKLILDLAGVGFMDSSGLSVLVSAYKAVRSKGGDMVLLSPTPTVQALIELTRLHQVFEIFSERAAAMARLS